MSRYDVNSILESSTLPIGGAAKRLKDAEQAAEMTIDRPTVVADDENMSSQLTADHGWPAIAAFQQAQAHHHHQHQPYSSLQPFGYGQRIWCKQEQDEFNHQLQLGSNNSNTHNFFQPSVMHNLMNMESSSLEHSCSSNNSVIYNNGDHTNGSYQVGYGSNNNNNNGGFVIPMGTVIASNNDHGFGESDHQAAAKALAFENMFSSSTTSSSSDPYQARNLYYLPQQQSSASLVKAAGAYDNWVPTAVPTLAQRSGNIALCHGAPTFTVWNDT